MSKKWKNLQLSNDFIFGKVMQNPDLCKKMLERILPDLKIDRIEYLQLQKEFKPDNEAKSIKLDVYVKDNAERVYDVEIQTTTPKELPKRSRYYQGTIDLQLINKGQEYNVLNSSYIIFICLTDVFGKGRHIYTFERTCKEDPEVHLNDGATIIFLNASGQMDDVSNELKAFLDYIAGHISDDPYVQELEQAVVEANKNREWRQEYMSLLMKFKEHEEIGKEEDRKDNILRWTKEGRSIQEIAQLLDKPVDYVETVLEQEKVLV